jgi:NTE family protein
VGKNPLRRLLRYTSVVMNQAQSLRKRMLVGDFFDNKYQGTYWSIKGDNKGSELIGYSEDIVHRRITEVRTDLDAFTEGEQRVLENHGYAQSSHRLERYASQLMAPDTKTAELPHAEYLDEQRVDRALRHSHKRVSLARLLGRA